MLGTGAALFEATALKKLKWVKKLLKIENLVNILLTLVY